MTESKNSSTKYSIPIGCGMLVLGVGFFLILNHNIVGIFPTVSGLLSICYYSVKYSQATKLKNCNTESEAGSS